jgi:adenylate cyclase
MAETDPRASEPGGVPTSQKPMALSQLGLLQRFHVRLTMLYGAFVLLALAAMAAAFYTGANTLATEGIRSRLAGTTVAIAHMLDRDKLGQLRSTADTQTVAYKNLHESVRAIDSAEKDLLSIYVLTPTEKPGVFTFAFDFVAPGKRSKDPATIGQTYDARENETLQRGLKEAVVETEIAHDAWGDSLSGYAPVVDASGARIALVGVDVDAGAIRRTRQTILGLSIALSIVVALVLCLAGMLVGRSVRRPLNRFIEAANAVSSGDLETRVSLTRADEFGILSGHFDAMTMGLQEREAIRATFGRYVSKDVATRVLGGGDGARMGGEVRRVTVLFSDLRGYSTISETLSPTETVEFLNEYLEVMNAEIDQAGGCIIEFLGDAILAVFGAPNELENHPEKAVRCAMAMREKLAIFNARMDREGRAPWKAKGMAGLGQRIGIHTGQVVAGNLGSKVRVKYAVIGDAVNVASRCEGLNKTLGTEILCTASTYDELPDALKNTLTDKGAHDVKGRANKVTVFAA